MRAVGLMDNFVNSSGLAALANGGLGHLGVEVFGGLIVEPAAGGVSAEAVSEIVGLGAVVEFSFFFVSHATQVGLNGRNLDWPRGKVLGGSSSINGLLYVRGQQQDFDHWRQLGNAGWSFDDVLPYFIKAEDQERGASE